MRMKYIAKIQAGLKRYHTIPTGAKTSRILDGSYNSVFKGRSMNFDELREYAQGDDVKDIDWKASSRSQKLLVRQYIAEKKHNIMLVLDTNRRMLAEATDGTEKRELALLGGGTLAYMVTLNGDYVGATYATENSVEHNPFRMGLMNLELILDRYYNAATLSNRSGLDRSLSYILHNLRRRMIVVIVTDREGICEMSEGILRQLMVKHDVILMEVGDANIEGQDVYDIEQEQYLPDFFTRDKKLNAIAKNRRIYAETTAMEKLKNLGIASVQVQGVEDLDDQIINLLNKHKNEKR